MKKVFFVTTNLAKVTTPVRVLARHGIEVERVDLELQEIQARTVAEVVAAKVRSAFRAIQSPVIVNDGSILIDALNGFPGPYVKHVNQQIGIEGYMELMRRFSPGRRGCTVEDAVGYIDAGRMAPAVFVRRVHGVIANAVCGTRRKHQMTLSPIFIPQGYAKTYAEMTDEEYEAFRETPENEQVYEQLAAAILAAP